MIMNQSIKEHVRGWAAVTDDRSKLQHAYLALAGAITVISGILSLFDAPLGRTLVGVAVGALIIFIVNAIVWSLLFSTLSRSNQLAEIKPRTKTTSRKR